MPPASNGVLAEVPPMNSQPWLALQGCGVALQ
jgi:hypothetical protein